MEQFAVLRFRKLKTPSAIAATGRHNRRTKFGQRDLNDKPWQSLCGSGDLLSDCRALWPAKRRKNAVLAVEIVLSASPAYFRPANPSARGEYDWRRYEEFETVAWSFLQMHFPGMVVDCVAHFSETTPHLHAVMVPLDESGKLNARKLFFGSPKLLAAWQSAWSKACEPLGLARGVSSLITGRKHRPLVAPTFVPQIASAKPLVRTVPDLRPRV